MNFRRSLTPPASFGMTLLFTKIPTATFVLAMALLVTSCLPSAVQSQEIQTEIGGHSDWEQDIDEAIKIAKKDNKNLFVAFTGSDWCPPCIRLEKEVLSKKDFLREVSKNFVLVLMDFPQDQSGIPTKIIEKNQDWMKRLGVDGYPTIVLMDIDGHPYGFLGYQKGGPNPYLESVRERMEAKTNFDRLLEKAISVKGDERARALDEAIEAIGIEIGRNHYGDIVKDILKLDNSNKLGLREKYRGDLDAQQRKAILAEILLASRLQPAQEVLKLMDNAEKELPMTPKMKSALLQIRVDLYRRLKQIDKASATLDKLASLYKDDHDGWQRMLVRKFYLLSATKGDSEAEPVLTDALKINNESPRLLLAKGELENKGGKVGPAVTSFDKALGFAVDDPDLYAQIVAAKADILFEAGKSREAKEALDRFSENKLFPVDLRARILLHKSVFLRKEKRTRAARLTENKAISMIKSPKRKAEMERFVKQVRSAFEKSQTP